MPARVGLFDRDGDDRLLLHGAGRNEMVIGRRPEATSRRIDLEKPAPLPKDVDYYLSNTPNSSPGKFTYEFGNKQRTGDLPDL